ncbi:uncharacterized protein METZ01_LOCUS213451, partial [marine metagenome]
LHGPCTVFRRSLLLQNCSRISPSRTI